MPKKVWKMSGISLSKRCTNPVSKRDINYFSSFLQIEEVFVRLKKNCLFSRPVTNKSSKQLAILQKVVELAH